MKKLLLFLSILFISTLAHATAYTAPYASTVTGGYIYASQWNANQTQLEAFLNNQNLDGTTNIAVGGVLTQNIADSAVTDAKISGITTAGKVNGSAITGLNNVPSGAGQLPQANLSELTSAGNLVDGSALTGLPNTQAGAGILPIANGGTGTSTGVSGILGTWTSIAPTTIYHAPADGFVTAYAVNTGSVSTTIELLSDSSSSPATIRSYSAIGSNTGGTLTVSSVVRKNDYYEIVLANGASYQAGYFISLGS